MYKPTIYQHPNDIPSRKYLGYLWDCQSENPKMISPEETYDFSHWGKFPFILEGLLHHKDEKEELSILIRYTDQYHISAFNLKELKEDQKVVLEPYEYIAHRLNGIAKINFQQIWFPEEDPLSEDMPVLRMKARLFTGFTPTQKS